MSLAKYKPLTRTVSLDKQSFEVHGLSASDFRMLVEGNIDSFEALVSLFDRALTLAQNTSSLDATAMQEMALALIRNVPAFAPTAIALAEASDDEFEDKLNGARRLPLPVQVATLIDIAQLTFEEVGGIKKFKEKFASVMPIAQANLSNTAKTTKNKKPPSSGSITA